MEFIEAYNVKRLVSFIYGKDKEIFSSQIAKQTYKVFPSDSWNHDQI